jgi:hypothetical protein
MTGGGARRTMIHVANLAPGWGEAGLLFWWFVTLPSFRQYQDAFIAIAKQRASSVKPRCEITPSYDVPGLKRSGFRLARQILASDLDHALK